MTNEKKKGSLKRSLIEWGLLIGVALFLYLMGWHTQVIGTMQRGLLATGLIKPTVPELTANFPPASPDFFFADPDGVVRSLGEHRGEVVFMNIWATWCPPCIAEMPSIQALYDRIGEKENVRFLIVSVDEDFTKAEQFMERRNFNLPIYHFRSRAPGTYDSSVIPTTYVISPDGRLALEKRGLAKYDTREFEQFILDLSGI
ncbi:MAG: TlpA family protein disulfide reductase [Balneolaceae bacterium]|nr:MAG: TlpA family protein disulfide reductase [Balneolaceae bacterium]